MFGLIARLGVIFSVPLASVFNKAYAGELLDKTVSEYSVESIIVLCGVMMIAGCIAFIMSPDPEGVPKVKAISKVAFSIFGSLTAFLYIVQYEQPLNIVHAAWIGGVSYASPAFIPSLKALVYELVPVATRRLKDFATRFIGGSNNE